MRERQRDRDRERDRDRQTETDRQRQRQTDRDRDSTETETDRQRQRDRDGVPQPLCHQSPRDLPLSVTQCDQSPRDLPLPITRCHQSPRDLSPKPLCHQSPPPPTTAPPAKDRTRSTRQWRHARLVKAVCGTGEASFAVSRGSTRTAPVAVTTSPQPFIQPGTRYGLALSPFLIGRMFLCEPSWKYSAKLVGS